MIITIAIATFVIATLLYAFMMLFWHQQAKPKVRPIPIKLQRRQQHPY